MSDYDSKIIRKQIRVYGSVQGVGFRYRTEHAAESVGATGDAYHMTSPSPTGEAQQAG